MMSMTHIAVGISTALLLSNPTKAAEFLPPIIGGAVGGIISDVDTRSNSYCRDALYGRLTAIGIALVALAIDWFTGSGIMRDLLSPDRRIWTILGLVVFLALVVVGIFQKHRQFTHSLLYGGLTFIAVFLMSYKIGLSFFVGFISHLLLDCLNKKPIRLFFPAEKGVCLNLCYANKTANKVFLIIGIILIGFCVIRPFI